MILLANHESPVSRILINGSWGHISCFWILDGKHGSAFVGEIGPDQLITKTDTADVQAATLNFGLGNWYLVKGDTVKARAAFERSIKSGGWPGFGFIVSEVDLRRTAKK